MRFFHQQGMGSWTSSVQESWRFALEILAIFWLQLGINFAGSELIYFGWIAQNSSKFGALEHYTFPAEKGYQRTWMQSLQNSCYYISLHPLYSLGCFDVTVIIFKNLLCLFFMVRMSYICLMQFWSISRTHLIWLLTSEVRWISSPAQF